VTVEREMPLTDAIAWLKGRARARCDKGAIAWSLDDVKAVRVVAAALPDFDRELCRLRNDQGDAEAVA
jgi:hypothetical protein